MSDITPDDLGIAQPDLSQVDSSYRKPAKKAGPRNAIPVPPGTPDRYAVLWKMIPSVDCRNYMLIYEGFIHKDMGLVEFCVEMASLSNLEMAQRDLDDIMARRAMMS